MSVRQWTFASCGYLWSEHNPSGTVVTGEPSANALSAGQQEEAASPEHPHLTLPDAPDDAETLAHITEYYIVLNRGIRSLKRNISQLQRRLDAVEERARKDPGVTARLDKATTTVRIIFASEMNRNSTF